MYCVFLLIGIILALQMEMVSRPALWDLEQMLLSSVATGLTILTQ